MMTAIRPLFLLGSALLILTACSTMRPTAPARIWKEPDLAPPGGYRLQLLLDGRGSLGDYLAREKAQNPALAPFTVAGLQSLLKQGYPSLTLPVPPGVPLCHLEQNFSHCRGIELQANFHIYADQSVVLYDRILYHVRVRLEENQPNFFRSALGQRNRGEFALPRHYYVGSLVEAIQKELPILQEITRDYRKYLRSDGQEIEIALILEESIRAADAARQNRDLEDGAHLSGSVLVSLLPSLSPLAGMTISALHSGGRSFWEILKEKQEFDFSKEALDLKEVRFSYLDSFQGYLSRFFRLDKPSDILIRGIVIRLLPQPDLPPAESSLPSYAGA